MPLTVWADTKTPGSTKTSHVFLFNGLLDDEVLNWYKPGWFIGDMY